MRSSLRNLGRFAILGGVVGGGSIACESELSISEPPDVSEIVRDYRSPSGRLPEVDLSAFAAQVESTFDTWAQTSSLGFSDDIVGASAPAVSDLDLEREEGADTLEVAPLDRDELVATIDLQHTCEGYEGETVDTARGQIDLRGAADASGLYPLFWGNVSGCRFQWSDRRTELNGALSIFVDAGQSRVTAQDIREAPIIAIFDGSAVIDEGALVEEDLHLDVRFTRQRTVAVRGGELRFDGRILETRVQVGEEVFILLVAEGGAGADGSGGLTAGIRGADGLWGCTIAPQEELGTCEQVATSEEVRWP